MRRITTLTGLYLALTLTTFAQSAYDNVQVTQPDECPVTVKRFEVDGGFPKIQYIRIHMKNNSLKAIESVEYQFEAFDYERQRARGRYYLAAGKMVAWPPSKPIQPGQTKSLSSVASRTFGLLYEYRQSDGEEIKVNVVHFTDGTKWERKGWRPN